MRHLREWITFTVGLLLVAGCADDPDLSTDTSALVDPSAFVLPSLNATDRAEIVQRYAYLDPTNKVPRGLLEDAIVYYDVNQALIPKPYIVVVDFSRYSGRDRFWLVDLTTGNVEAHKVAHGDGSDPDNDGFANTFSNVNNSHQSSLGFYLTGEIYDGTHPHSMRIDGLSPDHSPNGMANTNVRERLIVMHEATYVSDSNSSQQGRSNGCFALDPAIEHHMVDRIHNGSLIYAATSPLWSPVGKEDDPGTTNGSDPDTSSGGCSTGRGDAGVLLALALVGLGRRRKRAA